MSLQIDNLTWQVISTHLLSNLEDLLCSSLKIEKSALVLENSIHLWLKFSIQNVVLRVSSRKVLKIFPCGVLFSCVFDETFIEVP